MLITGTILCPWTQLVSTITQSNLLRSLRFFFPRVRKIILNISLSSEYFISQGDRPCTSSKAPVTPTKVSLSRFDCFFDGIKGRKRTQRCPATSSNFISKDLPLIGFPNLAAHIFMNKSCICHTLWPDLKGCLHTHNPRSCSLSLLKPSLDHRSPTDRVCTCR